MEKEEEEMGKFTSDTPLHCPSRCHYDLCPEPTMEEISLQEELKPK